MQDWKRNVELWGKLAGISMGFLAAVVVVFLGFGSWDIKTIVYGGSGAALVTGTVAYYFTHRYLSNRLGDGDE
jgi:hypothetical protein